MLLSVFLYTVLLLASLYLVIVKTWFLKMKIEKITSDHNTIGEGGFWDVTSETFTWVDIREKAVLKYSPREGKFTRLNTGKREVWI